MFAKSFTAIALLASSVFGAVTFTSVPSGISAGQSYTLLYSADDTTTPVTITLRKGNPQNLDTIGALTTTSTGGSFTWTVPADIVSGTDYALMISQGTADVNYFGPFSVSGGTGVASSVAVVSPSGSASPSHAVVSASASGKISSLASLPTAKPSGFSNSTTTKSSLSTKISTTKLPSSTSSGPSASATSAPNGASSLSSPVALILGAVAAMFYLH